MSNRKVKISDITDFVTASDSELFGLSDDENDTRQRCHKMCWLVQLKFLLMKKMKMRS